MKNINLLKIKAFTLIEILLGISLFSIIVLTGFYAFSAVSMSKIKLIEKTNIEKESFFFGEKLFEEIKKGGVIDYEEYFNRKVVNAGYVGNEYGSGHYKYDTGFGNFGSGGVIGTINYGRVGYYYCRSGNGATQNMGSGGINPNLGCRSNNLNNFSGTTYGVSGSYSGKYEIFGQYYLQFIDYNSDYNNDGGDSDGNGFIYGDDDDENLGIGPEVFSSGGEVKELYLISGNKQKRTFFRRNVKVDPKKPLSETCDFSNPSSPTGSGCLGTIEFLKMNNIDIGKDHDRSITGKWQYDGIPDTWIINPDFSGTGELVAGSNTGNYWVPLFPDSINVKDVRFYLYPNKDLNLAWKEGGGSNFSQYLRISYTLTPSRAKRGGIKGKIPELNFSTTITLSDLFSKK
nr:hypothetical protein [Candidatus Gracilibacteria bacterium]